jgi:hypothetical protein
VGECRDILLHCNIYVASLTSLQIWKKKALVLVLCIKPTTASSPLLHRAHYCINPTTLSCRGKSIKGHVFKKSKKKKRKRPRMLMSGTGSQDRRLSDPPGLPQPRRCFPSPCSPNLLTLKFANILNVGTVHEGIPSSDFPIFDLPTCFFWHLFLQNWNLRP